MNAPANFAATRWTLIARARGHDPAAREALSELCAAYYAPVSAFLRSEGRTEDQARELTHGFFAGVLADGSLGGADPERGRFRSYLLGAVKHFLADLRDRDRAEKRGGGAVPVSLEETASGLEVPDGVGEAADSERAFDRQWALTVIARALTVVETELRDAGKGEQFMILKPWITAGESPELSRAAAAEALGTSESAVKVAIHRLRQRFRETVKSEIARTVPAESDVDDELRYLIEVLSGSR